MRKLVTISILVSAMFVAAPGVAQAITVSKNIKRYTKTYLIHDGIINYHCEAEPSAWRITTQPKRGIVQIGTFPAPNPYTYCSDKTIPLPAIFYTWTAHNNVSLTDTFTAVWTGSGLTTTYAFRIAVIAVRPVSETTQFEGWWSSYPTVGEWRGILIPPASDSAFDFQSENVRESDPGTGTSDTCWFAGSPYVNFTKVTGGQWTVNSQKIKNSWITDWVGYLPAAVTFYRARKKVPCGSTYIPQQMTIKSQTETSFKNYGPVSQIGAQIGVTTVTSRRAGKSVSRVWP